MKRIVNDKRDGFLASESDNRADRKTNNVASVRTVARNGRRGNGEVGRGGFRRRRTAIGVYIVRKTIDIVKKGNIKRDSGRRSRENARLTRKIGRR